MGYPHAHAARDGKVKSTGCPHGVRLQNQVSLPTDIPEDPINLSQAAEQLDICAVSVRKLVAEGVIEAEQIISGAPFFIPQAQLSAEKVLYAVKGIKKGSNRKKNCPALPGQENLSL